MSQTRIRELEERIEQLKELLTQARECAEKIMHQKRALSGHNFECVPDCLRCEANQFLEKYSEVMGDE